MLAQLGLLCLYAKPLSQHWLNRLCWALGLFTLFLAQSKASWLSFPVCAACIFWMRGDVAAWRRSSDARLRLSSLFLPLTVLLVTVVLGLIYIFGNLGLTIDSFWTGHRAADLLSFTGRDRIWAVALEEWTRHPVFGYGSNLWDEGYRADIGMPFAFDGHNQLVDALARSGLVGAAGLMLYATSLLVYSVKHARATRGFCLAIFLAIALRSVAEVPLGLFRYGPEALQHFLLLAILAGKARARSAPAGGHSAAGPLPLTQRG
jgi:O-antigen ligase